MATNNAANIVTAATGKVLQGAGVGVAPTFSTATYPSTATSTGTILRADGTNWTATTATYPSTAGTSGNVLTSDGTNWTSSTPASAAKATFSLQCATGSPSDATTYYLVTALTLTSFTASSASSRFYIPIAGTIDVVYGVITSGTPGTSEATTIAIRKNDTSNSNISASLNLSSSPVSFNNTSLGLTVVAGDFIEFILICPTWVTNPASVKVSITAMIS